MKPSEIIVSRKTRLVNMDGDHELASLPSGTCPLCQTSIARRDIKIAKPFACPHCGRSLRTTISFRVLLYLVCYGISAAIVFNFQMAWWMSIVLWLVVAFLLGLLYTVLLLMFFPAPTLEVYRSGDFQELDLHK